MTKHTPYNPAAHEALTGAGYIHHHYDADWCEDGDPENGPHLTGHPAVDIYTDHDTQVVIYEDGTASLEPAPPPAPEW